MGLVVRTPTSRARERRQVKARTRTRWARRIGLGGLSSSPWTCSTTLSFLARRGQDGSRTGAAVSGVPQPVTTMNQDSSDDQARAGLHQADSERAPTAGSTESPVSRAVIVASLTAVVTQVIGAVVRWVIPGTAPTFLRRFFDHPAVWLPLIAASLIVAIMAWRRGHHPIARRSTLVAAATCPASAKSRSRHRRVGRRAASVQWQDPRRDRGAPRLGARWSST